jgi:tape measure domain-containing protein
MNPNIIDIRVTAKDLASSVLKGVNSSVLSLGGVSKLVGAAIMGVGTALASVGAAATKASGDFEQQAVAFKTMLGSADQAIILLQKLQEFAKKTPFELTDLQQSAKTLLAYNFSATQIIPTLETIGNIAAGVGKDKIPVLIRALGQIKAKGELKGGELLQLTETGLPIAETLAKKVGVSVKTLNEDVSKLHIPFSTVLETIKDIEKQRFAGLMSEQSKTLYGTWSNIVDTVKTMATNLGLSSGLLATMKDGSKFLLDSLDRFSQSDGFAKLVISFRIGIMVIKNVGTAIYNTVNANRTAILSFLKFASVIGISIFAATKVIGVISAVGSGISALSVALVPTIALTIAFGLAIYSLYTYMARVSGQQIDIGKTTNALNAAFKSTGELVDNIGSSMGDMGDATSSTMKEMKKAIDDENKSYTEQLVEIVRNARERLDENKKSLTKEEEMFKKNQLDKIEQYKQETDSIREQNNNRLQDMEESFRKTIIVGSSSYDEDLANYRTQVELVKEQNQKRLEDAQMKQKQESDSEKADYEERTNELRIKIENDQKMLTDNAALIQGLNVKARQDEITELRATHKQRLLDIKKQYASEVSMGAGAFDQVAKVSAQKAAESQKAWNKAFESMPVTIKLQLPTMKEMLIELGRNVVLGILKISQAVATSMANSLFGKVFPKYKEASKKESDKAAELIKLIEFDAKGMTPAYAKGSDSLSSNQIAMVHKGEKIVPADDNPDNPDNAGLGQRGGNGVTIVNNFVNTIVDANALSSRLSFQFRNS